MNKIFQVKNLLILIILICVIGVFYYLISSSSANQQAAVSPRNQTGTAIGTTTSSTHVPVDIFHDTYNGSTITSSSTGTVLTMKISNNSSINPTQDIYENGTKIGGFQAEMISSVSSSPDNKYIGFRTVNHIGGSNFEFGLGIANLVNKSFSYVYLPPVSKTGVQGWPKGAPISLYIDSYTWEGNSVNMVLYFISSDGYKYYRVSPEETWNYNLETGKYTKLGN